MLNHHSWHADYGQGMHVEPDGLEQKVRAWIESSGRALELRVARAVRRVGGAADQSFTYVDPVSSQTREGDVRATFYWAGLQDTDCRLIMVIECKSGKDKPWIGFRDRTRPSSAHLEDWTIAEHGPFVGLVEPLTGLWVGQAPFDNTRMCSHVVTAFGDKNNSANPANDAVRQALSAAGGQWQKYLASQSLPSDQRYAAVIMACVVTEAPLFECALNREGEVITERVDEIRLRVERHDGKATRLWIMNEERLHTFLEDLRFRAHHAEAGEANT